MKKMHYSVGDGIAQITLDDGKMNAMNWEFFSELNESLDRALADKAGVLIFTCRPGVFSAGLDLKLLPTQSFEEVVRFQKTFATTMLRVLQFPIPTVAAYEGHAVAGGAILSYACDRYMILDGPYKIQINEVANKMVIPSWILLICRSSIPHRWWKEALLHSRAYTPREAFERGIVDALIEAGGNVLDAAREASQDLLKLDRRAYGTTKSFLYGESAAHTLDVFYREIAEWQLGSE